MSRIRPMKVLLTGHSGFIGQSILKLLLKKKIKLSVTKYNNLSIPEEKKITVIDLKKKFLIKDFDLVIHTAWENLDNYNSKQHIKKILPSNIKFLTKLIKKGAKNLVILGTCFEVGDCSGEIDEKIKLKPKTKYGLAKKKLLFKLLSIKKKYNFNLTWIRIFYLYGQTQRNKSLFKQIQIASKNKNQKIFEMTSGNQIRDYLHVDKLSKKIISISFLKKNLGIINVCSGKPISVKKLVLKWKKRFKWDIEFSFGNKEQKKYEPLNFWGSTKKFKNVLKQN